jgi:VanZ family protein
MVWSFLWTIVVGFLYLMPGKDLPTVSIWELVNFDKAAHAIVFAIFAVIALTGLHRQVRYPKLRNHAAVIVVGVGTAYGAILELMQGAFAAGRVTEFADMLANLIGCVVGFVIFRIIYRGVIQID